MKRVLTFVVGCTATFVAHVAQAEIRIVTTTTDLAAIARVIGADLVAVQSFAPPTGDPHFLAAKPSMIRRAHDADLILLIGADMEVGWLPAILQSARNSKILPGQPGWLDLSQVVPLLDIPAGPVNRSMGDIHPSGNPHYWLDPRNGIRIARAIADRLSMIDPANAGLYRDRATVFEADVDRRYADWRDDLAALQGRPVLSYHTSFRYLADAFGFTIADHVEPLPGIAPTPAHLNHLVAAIDNQNINLVLIEPYYERRSTRYLNDQTGLAVAVIPQSVGALDGIDSYVDLFDGIVAAINSALGS